MREIDLYFNSQPEPQKSCLLALRQMILSYDKHISETWRYRMPFYLFIGKRFCYLWIDKTSQYPYLGIVDGNKVKHPDLIQENRKRMKILPINPKKNIPIRKINTLLKELL